MDCSTSRMAVPCCWMRRTTTSSCSTTVGARPRDSSSMMSSFGLAMKAMPSASICCSPPERLPAIWSMRSREAREQLAAPPRLLRVEVLRVVPVEPAGGTKVLGHGERGEHRLAAWHLHDAHRGGLPGVGVGDVATFEEDGAAHRVGGAADRAQQRRLAGAVRAEQRDDLAGHAPRGRPRRAPAPARRPPRRPGR